MQISATVHLQKKFQYEQIPVLLSTVQPIVLICRAGKNSSVHRSIQRMGKRYSKPCKLTLNLYSKPRYIFTFTFSKTFTIAEHWALTQMAALLTFRWQHYRAK